MKLSQAQLLIFLTWFGSLFLYLIFFVLIGEYKHGVSVTITEDAEWRVAGTLVPICSAFFGFWFGPNFQRNTKKIDAQRVYIAFFSTLAAHGFILFYLVVRICLKDLDPISIPEREQTLKFIIDRGLNLLWLLSSFAVAPVSWLLSGAKVIVPTNPPPRSNIP